MGIFCGAVYAALIISVFFGPERFHRALIVPEDAVEEVEEIDEYSSDVLVYEHKHGAVHKV